MNTMAEVDVSHVDVHYNDYKELHDVMMHGIENDTTLSTAQKMIKYAKKFEELKTRFKLEREKVYQQSSIELSKGNSCVKTSPGGFKKCQEYIDAPPDYYTRPEWTSKYRENGTSMNAQAEVEENGTRVWSKIKKRGHGRAYEEIRAVFHLEPIYIQKAVSKDAVYIFNKILGSFSVK